MNDAMTFTEKEYILADTLGDALQRDEPMARHTTLKVGGPARWFWAASDVEALVRVLSACTRHEIPYLFVGHGSNLLMSDAGYDGLVIQNRCKGCTVGEETLAESGVSFGSLFLQTARAGFGGLEWAIGIPGTVGGALVSNAGAYRGNIGPLVRSMRVFAEGRDQTVGPDWMEFSYRDSRLRRSGAGNTVILSCVLHLAERGDPDTILARAKEYQAQRRAKQPFRRRQDRFQECCGQSAVRETAQFNTGHEGGRRGSRRVSQRSLRPQRPPRRRSAGVRETRQFLINAEGATASGPADAGLPGAGRGAGAVRRDFGRRSAVCRGLDKLVRAADTRMTLLYWLCQTLRRETIS